MSISRMSTKSGRLLREDDTAVNEANYIAPKPTNHETLTIQNTAGGTPLTALKTVGAIQAYISVETASIRYWLDGSAPTATQGILLEKGDAVALQSSEEIAGFLAIAVSDAATVQVGYSG